MGLRTATFGGLVRQKISLLVFFILSFEGIAQVTIPSEERGITTPLTQYVNPYIGTGIGWDAPMEAYIEKINDTTLVGYRYSKGWAADQKIDKRTGKWWFK
jgi:hypothetical protein